MDELDQPLANAAKGTVKPIISFRNITKRWGSTVAVDNVSLDIEPGEFFALLGPSGCGKTTLLRMLAGLEIPTEGHILIDGQDMGDIPPNKRAVNMVFQSYAVFPHMTVANNVAYGLKIEGVPQAERDRRVQEALELVQLGHLGARMPDQLSGGQRQRVALARALVKKPKVLLLDEPLSALDAKLREAMRFELSQLQQKVGITFIMVTHDQTEALAIASRVAVMNKGSIAQIGTPVGPLRVSQLPFRRRLHRLGEHVRGHADRRQARRGHRCVPRARAASHSCAPFRGRPEIVDGLGRDPP